MIPKIIHYCWFGGNPLPAYANKCIESWKKFFPDYEIKEWNESNFDLNSCDYVKEAYDEKKWAFVSDYARFKILYENGGIYFDTDVEVIKSFDDVLEKGSFMGQEAGPSLIMNEVNVNQKSEEVGILVNPGLGIAAQPGLTLYREILDYYKTLHFKTNGIIDTTTVCVYTTRILKKYGYNENDEKIQKIGEIIVYTPEYFCPQNFYTGNMNKTGNTHSIHHYSASWFSFWEHIILKIETCRSARVIEYKMRRIISFPFRVVNKIDKIGLKKTFSFARKKLIGN